MVTDVEAWIKERQATIREARESIRPADAVELGLIDLPAALDALSAVLELHGPVETGVGDQYWKEPDYCPTCREYWPCATYEAIEGAVNEQ